MTDTSEDRAKAIMFQWIAGGLATLLLASGTIMFTVLNNSIDRMTSKLDTVASDTAATKVSVELSKAYYQERWTAQQLRDDKQDNQISAIINRIEGRKAYDGGVR